MPELPEVEVVRRGLARWVAGRPSPTSRCCTRGRSGATWPARRDFAAGSPAQPVSTRAGAASTCGCRWTAATPLLAHLGMSGQLLVQPAGAPDEKHLRIRIRFDDGGPRAALRRPAHLRRAVAAERRRPTAARPRSRTSPATRWTRRSPTRRVRGRAARPAHRGQAGAARPVADQRRRQHLRRRGAVAGPAALRPARPTTLTRPAVAGPARPRPGRDGRGPRRGRHQLRRLYVNVNGESGYFDRSLNAYGREGEPCPRCGAPIRREPFMNRSSYFCPRCQPRPRGALPG